MNFKTSFPPLFSILKKKKIRNTHDKYALYIFFIVFIPVVIIITLALSYVISSRIAHSRLETITKLNSTQNIISNTFEHMESSIYTLFADPQIQLAIHSDNVVDDSASINYARNQLSNIINQNDSITSASIYSFRNDYLFGYNDANFLPNIGTQHLSWYEHYKETGNTDFFIPVVRNKNNEICLVRSFKTNDSLAAFFVCHIDVQTLFSFKETEQYMLIDETSKCILYSTDSNVIGLNSGEINHSLTNFYSTGKKEDITLTSSKTQCILPYSNVTLLLETQNDNSYIGLYILTIIIILSAIIIVALTLANKLTNIFYSSISKTLAYLSHSTNESYDADTDELVWIENNIKNIINSKETSEKELAKNITRLRNSHLTAMQLQTNPHFLFNALNLANMYIITDSANAQNATEIISNVSDILRISLNTRDYFITLDEEISLVKKYIQIESLRYNHEFDVTYNITVDTLEYKIAKLSLQPLVENAFKHGIHNLPSYTDGKLIISVETKNDNILIKIADNGICDANTLSLITQNLNNSDNLYTVNDKGIGLKNVHSRIKLLFGNKFGCSIYRKDNWTISEIIIPKQI